MRDRSLLAAVISIGLVMPFIGCSNPQGLDSIQITPTSSALVVGQTSQFNANGQFGNASHPSTKNITSTVSWSSSNQSVATVSSTGVATSVGAGTTTISA